MRPWKDSLDGGRFPLLWLLLWIVVVAVTLVVLVRQSRTEHRSIKAKDLVGAWMYEESYLSFPDGRRRDQFTPKPAGIFMLNSQGWYAHIIMRPDLPKVQSGIMMDATPEEVQILAKGTLSHYGTYVVNERQGNFVVHIIKSDFPNFDGVKQVRHVQRLDNEWLHYVNDMTNAGPGTVVYAKLRRVSR